MTRPKWDRHLIHGELRRREITLTGLARYYGLPESAAKNIWTRPHEGMERAIADFLNEPVEILFSDRYPKRRGKILSSKYERPRASQKKAPATDRKAA